MMRDERRDLRRLFQQLSPAQWQVESLCAGWTVRDVGAHLLGWDDLLVYTSARGHLRALVRFSALFVRSLGSMNRLNRRLQSTTRGLTAGVVVDRFAAEDSADAKWLFDGTNPGAHLAEYVIHHEDIREPLGLSREIAPERLVAALDGLTKLPGVRWSAWRRLRRQRWEATDVEWRRGRGAVVRRPGRAILMELAGRPSRRSFDAPERHALSQ